MDMIFVSAQPDHVYFHWQVELYLFQFSKHNIQDKCYAIFGYSDEGPSDYIKELAKKYNVFWYKDDSDKSVPNYYIPSVRPNILKKFFAEHPHLGKNVFYHDSDIFIVKLPKFELLLNDDIGYLSDTVGYIGYDYIRQASNRYKAKYPELPDDDIFTKMCECVGISEDLVKENEKGSGGAQYLLKNVDAQFWEDVNVTCNKLYDMLQTYEKKYPIDHHIQSWTADMWAVLWEYWKRGNKTVVHSELDFSWATDSRSEYHKKNIFHLAGITESSKNVFFKGQYRDCNIFIKYFNDRKMFDHVSTKNSTFEYVKVLKEYADENPRTDADIEPEIVDEDEEVVGFIIDNGNQFDGTYYHDSTKQVCGKDVWRSENKEYIVFWNSSCWVLTGTEYEDELSASCGGYSTNKSENPYDGDW